ncbi:MAG: hypothetical protein V4693_20340 [Pseudomonadota bacterium]
MSILSVLGSRPLQSPMFKPAMQDGAAAPQASANSTVPTRLPVVGPVAPASGSVTLSQEALNARVAKLGDRTVDVAQRLLGNLAESLFGDAAKGATFNFSAISVSADTSLSTAVEHSSGAAGSVDTAALQFNESSSFIGRGQIVTEDGQSFDFEIEVKYEASLTAVRQQTSSATQRPAESEPMTALTGKQLPEVKFPGSLSDLFKLLGRQLDVATDSGKNDGNNGNLSLRLIRLVNTAALLAPRAPQDNPLASSIERNRALASYSEPAASTTVATA